MDSKVSNLKCTCGGLAQSEECALCKREAPGSKPGFSIWSYSVMVITVDFESTNPGSNPGRTSFVFRRDKKKTEKKSASSGVRTHAYIVESNLSRPP